jgi:DsrE/DsrF-like family
MARRNFLAQLAGLPFVALGARAEEGKKTLKILMRSSWGTDDSTRASFVFAHALALADAGHDVQIFLTGDATDLMRKATSDAIVPIGWPPLKEMRAIKSSQSTCRYSPAARARGPGGSPKAI